MRAIATDGGLAGFNSAIRRLVQKELKGKEKRRIVFIGCSGMCIPLAELIITGLRGIRNAEFYYILNAEKSESYRIKPKDIEFYWEKTKAPEEAEILIPLGGLTLPKYGIEPEKVSELISDYKNAIVIGASGSNVFKKHGWLDFINFDYLVDMSIEVNTYKFD